MFIISQNKGLYVNTDELEAIGVYTKRSTGEINIQAMMKGGSEYVMGEYETREEARKALAEMMMGPDGK